MIRTFRNHPKVTGAIFGVICLLFIVSSIGITKYGGESESTKAITINGREITFENFYQETRNTEQQYRSMFGKQYDQLAKQFGLNLPQITSDKLIADTLTEEFIKKAHLTADEATLKQKIAEDFPSGYNSDSLKSYLQYSGLTADQYLSTKITQSVKESLFRFIKDSVVVTDAEAQKIYHDEETKRSIQYIELSDSLFSKEVGEPTPEKIKEYYDANQTRFSKPAQISYLGVVFDPADFKQEVQVSQEDVELYYTDNEKKFLAPEQLKLRHIQLLFPAKDASTPEQINLTRTRAKEAWDKAKQGEAFSTLVSKYSDDFTTQPTGGDLGWVTKGKYPANFDEKTYAVKDGGLAELIETDYGFHIVQVEGHKDATPKPLPDVRGEIEEIIRNDQAPLIAETKAEEFFAQAEKNPSEVETLAAEKKFKIVKTAAPLTKEGDISKELKGLTEKVIANPYETVQLNHISDTSIVTLIKEFKDESVASLEEVSEPIKMMIKGTDAHNALIKKATELLETLKTGSKDLQSVAKELNVPVKEKKELSKTSLMNEKDPLFKNQEFSKKLFLASSPGKIIPQLFSDRSGAYLVKLSDVAAPKELPPAEKLTEIKKRRKEELSQEAITLFLAELKKNAEIVVSPRIYGGNES